MANVSNPFGLMPLMRRHGGGASQAEAYTKAVGYTHAIYKWDPVTLLAGVLNGPASGITPGTTRLIGVVLAGFVTSGNSNWFAASVAATLMVLDHRDDLFIAEGDGSTGSNVVAAKMGYLANLLLTTAGAGVTRDNSGVMIDESTINTTSSLDVKV